MYLVYPINREKVNFFLIRIDFVVFLYYTKSIGNYNSRVFHSKTGVIYIYSKIKYRIYCIIRAADESNLLSKIFDYFIISLILVNVFIVILDTFSGFTPQTYEIFKNIELFSIIIFSLEYLLRLWTANYIYDKVSPLRARLKYAISFMAIVDLLAILPFYIPFVIPVDLRVLRLIRLLRLFRILKMNRYTTALSAVSNIIKSRAAQLISSLFVIMVLMIMASVLMYSIEYEAQPQVFNNAVSGFWWAICTVTTVGYGDIFPVTGIGKVLGAVISLLGIGLVAVPTGIISAGFIEQVNKDTKCNNTEKCYCPYCGNKINEIE